jgi:4-amino-4-deoxy-L-arabinose transferase-like glycosyltransferase
MPRGWKPRPDLLLVLLLSFYLVVSVRHLTALPPIYEDEPWQASVAWKVATDGVFGSDLFAGFYGMERHYYAFMPVHPLILAAVFKLAGLGVLQMRLAPVVMGLGTLVLTYLAGRRVADTRVGDLAVLLLVTVSPLAVTRSQVTGIPMIDFGRIARYDMAVPLFGLAGLLACWRAIDSGRSQWHVAAGALAGVSALSHVYGAFWLTAILGIGVAERAGRRAALATLAGFALPVSVYLVFVLSSLADWRGQTREYGVRFALFDPAFYLTNLLTEVRRYGPGLGPAGPAWLARPGFWLTATAVPASAAWLAHRAIVGRDGQARRLLVPFLVLPALFALLIRGKVASYTVTMVPIAAVAVAWAAADVWRRARERGRWRRMVLAVALGAVIVEGVLRVAALESLARRTTPYEVFIARVREHIPAGARVLGLHNYWLGLHDLGDYRSWAVPLWLADPEHRSPALTIEQALDQVDPTVILIDSRMAAVLRNPAASDPRPAGVRAWMQRRRFVLAATVDDATYGRMEIHRR